MKTILQQASSEILAGETTHDKDHIVTMVLKPANISTAELPAGTLPIHDPTTSDSVASLTRTYTTPIHRYYIDTRSLAPPSAKPGRDKHEHLPLLHTLPDEIQASIEKYVRASDRYMHLASALLKRYFVHKATKIPFRNVIISRTPKPHNRPYWDPPAGWHGIPDTLGQPFSGVEWNVSHQGGLVVLVGCKTPRLPKYMSSLDTVTPVEDQTFDQFGRLKEDAVDVRIGVDVACTDEGPRTPKYRTREQIQEWVDVFSEMFCERERERMVNDPITVHNQDGSNRVLEEPEECSLRMRKFYTSWALKEAYIKMVGEGLLASWLRDLEFENVPVVPLPEQKDDIQLDAEMIALNFSDDITSKQCRTRLEHEKWLNVPEPILERLKVVFRGFDVSGQITTELEAFEDTFLVASMTRGVKEESSRNGQRWTKLDFEGDLEACATGNCDCGNQ